MLRHVCMAYMVCMYSMYVCIIYLFLLFVPEQGLKGILGVYDFLLSDESNRSYIKNGPGSFKLYNDIGFFFVQQVKSSKIKCAHPY